LKEIGARINAVTAIKMTTEAMKMIAQAKVTKAEARLKHCRLFSANIEAAFKAATSAGTVEEQAISRVQYVPMGTDQGLCGSINSGMGRHIVPNIENSLKEGKTVDIFPFGNRLISNIQSKVGHDEMVKGISGYQKALSFRQCLMMSDDILSQENQPDNRVIDFNRMVNMASYVVDTVEVPSRAALEQVEMGVYEVEGGNEVLDDFYEFYFSTMMWRVLSEVETSELSSRSMAMSNSTSAAEDMRAELQLTYSKIRQEIITTEIIEISTGATQTLKNKNKED
jgi:F-type H+-transporting ATPase subunit gamma